MAVWQSVTELRDGQSVASETFNRPISELTSRTDYLKNLLDKLLSGNDSRSSITIQVTLSSDNTPVVGDIVCIDPVTGLYVKAIASMSLYDSYTASEKAFAIGILISRNPDNMSGLVTLYGRIDIDDLNVDRLVERGVFTAGQYYLSSTTPGKITKFPNGPRVLVGYFAASAQKNGEYTGTVAYINPQHMDIEAHAHRTYTLMARPCGVSRVEGGDPSNDVPGQVFVDGYPPNGGAGRGIPGLVPCGDWTTDWAEDYVVTVSDNYGNTPSSWPCKVSWYVLGGDESGEGEIRFFGDSVAVGSHGFRVKLMPTDGMSESVPFQADNVSAEQRTWTVGRWDGRGWTSADATDVIDENGMLFRFGGVSNRFMNHVSVIVPEGIFDLTSSLQSISSGDLLSIDGEEYEFTKDPDKTGDRYIQIIDTVPGSTFDTLAQICRSHDGAAFYEDDELRQVLVGASSVVFNGTRLDPDLSNANVVSFAMVAYDTGESISPLLRIEGGNRPFSAIRVDSGFVVSELTNGLTLMPARPPESYGMTGRADIYCVPGARYRYNIEFDNDLKLHYPPVPARSGCLMLNGVEMESYENYGDRAVIAVGDDSIYWRDDTEGRQPWPVPEMSQHDVVAAEDEYRELFHFVSEFHSETGPVTSLHPAEGSPITVHRCGTDEDATVGDLELDVDLMIDMSDQNTPGYKVPKASRGNRLLLGPVVEKLIAGPGISFSRTAGVPEGQGTFTISADGAVYAGDFETVALENAKLESIGMFPYIRMLRWDPDSNGNVPTGFVAKFHMPATAADSAYRVKFYASVFGEESFSGESQLSAGIRMDYSILPDYTALDGGVIENANLKTGLIRPDNPFVIDIPFGVADDGMSSFSYEAFDPVLVHNDSSIGSISGKSVQVVGHSIPYPSECSDFLSRNRVEGVFGIRPGYTVAIRFSRSAPSSGKPYVGAIGFLNLRWSVEEVATIETSQKQVSNIDDIVASAVINLKKAVAKSGAMNNGYELAEVLTKIVNALK